MKLMKYNEFEDYRKTCECSTFGEVFYPNKYMGCHHTLCTKLISFYDNVNKIYKDAHVCNIMNCPDCDDINNYTILFENKKEVEVKLLIENKE